MAKHVLEFRRAGNAILLAERGDALEPGEHVLAAIRVTVLQLSVLFNDDDARRDALMLFHIAYRPDGESSSIDAADLHPVVRKLRLLIIGAGMGAGVLGVEE